jgi:hypothetical protein
MRLGQLPRSLLRLMVTPNLFNVRHSRMLLARIQAKLGLDLRQKHSGVTPLG